jgi:hypothetical protein
LLANVAETLGEPYSRHLGGKVRELRFRTLAGQAEHSAAMRGTIRPSAGRFTRRDLGDATPQVRRRVGAFPREGVSHTEI